MWGNQGGFGETSGGFSSPGGGGFMSSQGGDERKSRTRTQSLIPVNLAQVVTAESQGDKFHIHGVEVNQICTVGKVRSANEAQTRHEYELEDRTGVVVEVRQFVDNDENTPDFDRTEMMPMNSYIKVYGHIRQFAGKRSIIAFKTHVLEDMNELTTHMLEVIKAGVVIKKRASGGEAPMDTGHGTTTPMAGGYQGGQSDMTSGLNPIHQQVHALIKGSQEAQGITVQQIITQLRGLPEKKIRDAIEFLSSEGHIYSTVDEEHFKTTD